MTKPLSQNTYAMLRKHIGPDHRDDRDSKLTKDLISLDVQTLAEMPIKIDRDKFRQYVLGQLADRGYQAAHDDLKLSTAIRTKDYAMWLAKRIHASHGIDFVMARYSDDKDLREEWIAYCRLLLIAIHFDPAGRIQTY